MRYTVIGLATAAAIITAGSTLSVSAHDYRDYGGGMRTEGYNGPQGEYGRGEYRREFERREYPRREFRRGGEDGQRSLLAQQERQRIMLAFLQGRRTPPVPAPGLAAHANVGCVFSV